ncbi:hypothetical protein ADL27_36440 [Streptomyces sp. NRRL F-6602]|nr:hypothetical protein ADL27_36440 [Streptomyces sp. NRRL F-6602]
MVMRYQEPPNAQEVLMLAVPERITGPGGVAEELVWHKPLGPDPDAVFQRIACSDEDGIVVLLDAAPPAALHGDVRESAEVCPTAAIEVAQEE